MPQVSKGQMRFYRMRTDRLLRAVPTLDLRRKQLTRELLAWEARIAEVGARRDQLAADYADNPHAEIDKVVSMESSELADVNIAGAMLRELRSVKFMVMPYSLAMTMPSFDRFVEIKEQLLEAEESLRVLTESLAVLSDELSVTTQRINLFEKRLIPEYDDLMRYIRGRLEDKERSSVMVAKIAQAAMLGEQAAFESA